MTKDSSTKDLALSSNERLFLKKDFNPFFKFPIVKNLFLKNVKFYTFHAGFKTKYDDLLLVKFDKPAPVAAVYSKTSTPSAPIIWDKKNNKGLCKILIVNLLNVCGVIVVI